jgi:hypothetical protein
MLAMIGSLLAGAVQDEAENRTVAAATTMIVRRAVLCIDYSPPKLLLPNCIPLIQNC